MSLKNIFKDPSMNDNETKQVITPAPKKVPPKVAEQKKDDHKGERASKPGERYTENELMVRLKFFIGVCLALTLIGIVFTVLYSIMFVTQPLNAISPIDQKFFELIIPVATFLCGTLSGIMLAGSGKEAAMAGAAAQANAMNGLNKPPSNPRPLGPAPLPMGGGMNMNDPMPMRGDMGPDPMDDPISMSSGPTPGVRPIGKPAIKPISM
ncbi:MAG: hypothetical protein EB127_13235 [Alphaproteobacteria bacterium]|nr:hypothetical protein [Alphaproteobacteria bacterium]